MRPIFGHKIKMSWTKHIACMGRNAHRALVTKPDRKKPFGRPIIDESMDLREIA
jgi:hypothetical protein